MSAPDEECVVCGLPALNLKGWDGGFPSYRRFRKLWDMPMVWYSSVHFACLRGWEHRDDLLTELVDLATNAADEYDITVNGETHRITRSGLGFTDQLLWTDDILVLQHNFSPDWMIIDFSGSWQSIHRDDLLRLVRGEPRVLDGGRTESLLLSPAPPESEVRSWTLSDFLRHLGIESRYPGLVSLGATFEVAHYFPSGLLQYWIYHPLSIHPAALDYFRDRYARDGEGAFESHFMKCDRFARGAAADEDEDMPAT